MTVFNEVRYNNQAGALGTDLDDPAAGTSQTVIGLFATNPGFATLAAYDFVKLSLGPPAAADFEIVYLTAYDEGSPLDGTIIRGAEDAGNWPPVAHSTGSRWVVAPTAADFPAFPAALTIGNSPTPGAAQLSLIPTGLDRTKPVASLMDASPPWWMVQQSVATGSGTILVGCSSLDGLTSFIGHDLNLLYFSVDRGQSWTGVATPWDAGIGGPTGQTVITNIAFATGDWVVAVGMDQDGNCAVMTSTDLGLTGWAAVADTPITGQPGSGANPSIAFDGELFYLGIVNPVDGVGLWTSPDLLIWTPHTTGLDGESVTAIFATPTAVLVTGGGGSPTLVRTTNQGVSFTVPTFVEGDVLGNAATLAPDGNGNWLMWNAVPDGYSWQSLNDGASWELRNTLPAFATMFAAAFVPVVGKWVSAWGPLQCATSPARGFIIYEADVADPLVWTPTGYVGPEVSTPAMLVAV